MQELCEFAPRREWRLIEINASLSDIDKHREHLVGRVSSSARTLNMQFILETSESICST